MFDFALLISAITLVSIDYLYLFMIKGYFENQLKNAKNHIAFQLDYLFAETNINDQFQKRDLIEKSLKIINKINDKIIREDFKNDLALKLNISKDLLILNKIEEKKVEVIHNSTMDAEFELLARMLLFPEVIKIFQKELGVFENPNYTALAFEIIDHYQNYSSLNLDVFETKLLSHNKLTIFPIFIKIKSLESFEKSNHEIIELLYSIKKKKISKQRQLLENKRNIISKSELFNLEIEIIKLKQIEDKIESEKKYYEENLNERL
jgi:DNA primase